MCSGKCIPHHALLNYSAPTATALYQKNLKSVPSIVFTRLVDAYHLPSLRPRLPLGSILKRNRNRPLLRFRGMLTIYIRGGRGSTTRLRRSPSRESSTRLPVARGATTHHTCRRRAALRPTATVDLVSTVPISTRKPFATRAPKSTQPLTIWQRKRRLLPQHNTSGSSVTQLSTGWTIAKKLSTQPRGLQRCRQRERLGFPNDNERSGWDFCRRTSGGTRLGD